ncbi:uncharacterized protein LOC144572482 [Carex rostrata]
MPSPSKKPRAGLALVRFISSLRPDRRSGTAGSLPLQTGFPTSLADLYVKNQSRLKKPSKKTKKKRQVTNSECLLTVGSSFDPSDSATSHVLISSGSVEEVIIAEEERIPSVSDDVLVCQRRNSLGIGFVVTVNIFALALLAIFGKKLVVGFTALAFCAWFFDSVRFNLVQFFKPCAEARTNLWLEERSFPLVSPIREVEIQTESDSIELEIQCELNQSREFDEIGEESTDFCQVQARDLKKKNILKRLFLKNRSKKKLREKDGPLDDSIRGKEMETASNGEKEEDDVVNLVTEYQEEQLTREISPIQIKEGEISQRCEIKEGISWFIVFLMVILFGLIEGKATALILTIFCFTSVSLLELARNERKKRKHQIGSLMENS